MPYTRCPACATSFRISAPQLSAAGGQVRCGRCGARFDALESLTDDPSHLPFPPPLPGFNPQALAERQTPSTPLSDPAEAPDLGALLKVAEPEPPVEKPAPSAPPSHPSDGLDLSAQLQNARLEGPEPKKADGAPLPFPEDLSDFAGSYSHYEAQPESAKPRLAAAIAKGLGILALILTLVLQLAWFEREQLVYSPQGRALLGGLCKVVGCEPPPRRDLGRFAIVNRSILAQQQRPGVLDLRLEFVNQADFPQPYPRLRVTLLSQQWKPTAQRAFSPEEYLAQRARQNDLMEPQERIQVTLELVKPETGWTKQYRFDFL